MSSSYLLHLAVLAGALLPTSLAQSGSGKTTRYWDCCKPSCAWDKGGVTAPVKTCDKSDSPISDANAQSGCAGGTSYMCSDQSPWAVSDSLAYGFAAVSAGNAPSCCQCYKLTFTDTAIQGKSMIVQATNTGGDVSAAQFDLAIPGGGFGLFDACTSQWGATEKIWGKQYGGMSTNMCSDVAKSLQPGCGFRWDWMKGADNPSVNYEVVTCPAELVKKSGCAVTGYTAPNGETNDPAPAPAALPVPGAQPEASSGDSTTEAGGAPSLTSVNQDTTMAASSTFATSTTAAASPTGSATDTGAAGTDTTSTDTTGSDTTGSDTTGSDTTGSDTTGTITTGTGSSGAGNGTAGTGSTGSGDGTSDTVSSPPPATEADETDEVCEL